MNHALGSAIRLWRDGFVQRGNLSNAHLNVSVSVFPLAAGHLFAGAADAIE